jgi:hypothetical protein
MEKILTTEVFLPAENYESNRKERMKKDFSEIMDAIVPPMIDKIKEVIVTEMLGSDTELSAVVGVQIVSQLKEAGVDTSKLMEKKPTLRRLLEELDATEGKTRHTETKLEDKSSD